MKKDGRAILRTYIRPLAIKSGGVMTLPEDSQKFQVRDSRRIKFHLHSFGMASAPATNVLVSGILHGSPGVSNGDGSNTGRLTKRVLDTPKTSRRKCGLGHVLDSLV